MASKKNPKGTKGVPFSPLAAHKEEDVGEEKTPKVVPIGRYEGDQEYRKRKELAEHPSEAPESEAQHDPGVKEEGAE